MDAPISNLPEASELSDSALLAISQNEETQKVTAAELIKQMSPNIDWATIWRVLWKNPAPGASFAPSTVVVPNTDHFDRLIVYARNQTNERRVVVGEILDISEGCLLTDPWSSTYMRHRIASWTSATEVSFGEGQEYNGGTATTKNTACVPLAIVGVKTGTGRITI